MICSSFIIYLIKLNIIGTIDNIYVTFIMEERQRGLSRLNLSIGRRV